MKTIAITIDEDVLDRLDRVASGRGQARTNRSRLIRDAVREYVSRLERLTEEDREGAIVRRHRKRLSLQARALVHDQARP